MITSTFVNQAKIVQPNMPGTNGVVHTIDSVLIPPSLRTVWQVLQADRIRYLNFAEAITSTNSGLDAMMSGKGPFTVFAPDNAMYNQVLKTPVERWNNSGQQDSLKIAQLLQSYILNGHELESTEFMAAGQLKMASGVQQQFAVAQAQRMMLSGQSVVSPFDVRATNGFVHTLQAELDHGNGIAGVAVQLRPSWQFLLILTLIVDLLWHWA